MPKVVKRKPHARIGEVLKRLRLQKKLSLQEVADGCGLSVSFLSTFERGQSDISIGRLENIAAFFDHDIGTLLGYRTRLSEPTYVDKYDRIVVDRGAGVEYEVIRVPGMEAELNVMKFAPNSRFHDARAHDGFDIVYAAVGEVVLCVNDGEYVMREGDCVYYSAAYPHRLRNRSRRKAVAIGVTTGRMT
jgi:transcriptional regulator with XRE-family HTH domain